MGREDMDDQYGEQGLIGGLKMASRQILTRYPKQVALGLAALLVGGYASINAVFLQDREHPTAFFETRSPAGERDPLLRAELPRPNDRAEEPREITRIVFDDQPANQESAPAPVADTTTVNDVIAAADQTVAEMPQPLSPPEQSENPLAVAQQMLAQLGFYLGTVDGIDGPMTQAAIEQYKLSVGLRGIELTQEQLLTSLRNNVMVTAAIPRARPDVESPAINEPAAIRAQPEETPVTPAPLAPSADALPPVDDAVMKVQAGLRAFGNVAIEVDGVAGEQTRAAIREFQALFRLPVTGEIDQDLVAKMTAIGLID